jgi:putative NADPH-quinone reductase
MDLVVFAHPREDSLCSRVLRRLVDGGRGPVVVADLYRDGFSPVLQQSELAAYGQPSADPLVAKYQRQLTEAATATFVFPVWMYGMPAILKGYFDRVWTPGATFAFRDDGVPVGLLKLRRVGVVCTFGQPPEFYSRTADPVHLFFKQLVSQNCGPDCTIAYEPLFGTDKIEAPAVAAYLDRVSAVLAGA